MSIVYLSLLTAIIQAVPGAVATTDSQVLYWSSHVRALPFEQILDDVQAGPTEAWPVIVSNGYASPLPPGELSRQKALREVAFDLTRKIQAYRTFLHSLDDKSFIPHALKLLALRDYLAERPSYINWLLVDVINRVFVVEVAERLVKEKPYREVLNLVPGLGRFHLHMSEFARVAATELGKAVLVPGQLKEGDEVALFFALWKAVAGANMFPFPRSIAAAGTYDLLGSQHLELLLYRYVTGPDYYLHAAFPRTVQYYDHVGHILPVGDPVEFVSAMNGYPAPSTLGEKVLRNPLKFEAVYSLVSYVQRKRSETDYAFWWTRDPKSAGDDVRDRAK